jgi:cytochrome b
MSITAKTRIWDIPVRLFHWLWAGCFVTAWITHESARYTDIHVFAGYSFALLLIFRLVWGLTGSRYARFRDFAFGPTVVYTYLRTLWTSRRQHYIGHNPAGAWAIFLLLALGLAISVSGVVVLGLAEGHGPLGAWFNPAPGERWHSIHNILAVLMLILVIIHIIGVVAESILHRENLPGAMFTGHKSGDMPGVAHHVWTGVLILVLFAAGAGWYFHGYLLASEAQPYLPFIGPQLADNELWREECGSCHTAYHPVLLPQRSWAAVFAGQADHFGEDLMLDEETVAELATFHQTHAAETLRTQAAYKILRSIPADKTPLRITRTAYWQHRHSEIDDKLWEKEPVNSRANCDACHLDAAQGTYENGAMRLPIKSNL